MAEDLVQKLPVLAGLSFGIAFTAGCWSDVSCGLVIVFLADGTVGFLRPVCCVVLAGVGLALVLSGPDPLQTTG